MRTHTMALLSVLAATAITACGAKGDVCHKYQSTCTASCLDGSTPQFTAETDFCFFESVAPVGQDPKVWFCDPSATGGSAAALTCPSQATSGGPSDCTTCSAFTVSRECGCPVWNP